jgi:hypothetical protein
MKGQIGGEVAGSKPQLGAHSVPEVGFITKALHISFNEQREHMAIYDDMMEETHPCFCNLYYYLF